VTVPSTRVIGGRYVVLAELGRGGMGVVWRAEDRVMGRHVAVKELHLPVALSPDERRLFRERLLREARTAGRLSSPGIVTVYDVITDAGVDHIVMELIEARTLAEVVAARGPLDERAALPVAQQLVGALRAAHDNGVVHRDVKPSNVMLGDDGRVKLTDFGIAQAADDPRLTTTGSIIGSPGYLAPERLAGEEASPASDMWALGSTLYYALTGRAPFDRETTPATIAAVLHAEVPTLRTRNPLGHVLAGLMQRDPRARLTGAQAAALLAADATTPVQGFAGTHPLPAKPRAGWRLPVVIGAVALLIGLVGGFVAGRARGAEIPVLTYGAGAQVPVFDVTSAYCLQGRITAGRSVSSGATVTCSDVHDAEVYATFTPFDSTDDVPYPGVDAFGAFGRSACSLMFGSALIGGADKATLQVVVLVPGEQEFSAKTTSGYFQSRLVICALQSGDGSQLTGTRIVKPA
jgi:eukaryotic-like serine/threonine-protein kinase